ncbi:MAG: hypothetical protein WC554_06070 [Clostridia bacterium]|jgi:hypothetical protein
MKLTKRELDLRKAASPDMSRPGLRGVTLRNGILHVGDGFCYLGTPASLEEGDSNKETFLPSFMLEDLRPKPKQSIKVEQLSDGKLLTTLMDESGKPATESSQKIFNVTSYHGKFPDLEKAKVFDNPKLAYVELKSLELRKVLDALPRDCTITFGISHPDRPVEIVVQEDSPNLIRGLIMPFVKRGIPRWAQDDPRWVAPAHEVSLAEALIQATTPKEPVKVL